MPRHLDAEFAGAVCLFRGRRRWRHVLAMISGAVALILGSAVLSGVKVFSCSSGGRGCPGETQGRVG
jgi:hypothetical protein